MSPTIMLFPYLSFLINILLKFHIIFSKFLNRFEIFSIRCRIIMPYIHLSADFLRVWLVNLKFQRLNFQSRYSQIRRSFCNEFFHPKNYLVVINFLLVFESQTTNFKYFHDNLLFLIPIFIYCFIILLFHHSSFSSLQIFLFNKRQNLRQFYLNLLFLDHAAIHHSFVFLIFHSNQLFFSIICLAIVKNHHLFRKIF